MASKQRVLITGATGTQGRGSVIHCLGRGHDVHAFVRNPSSPAAQDLQLLGAKLVRGDFDDEESLRLAMSSIDVVIFIHPNLTDLEADLRRATNVVRAARSSPSVSTMIASTAVQTGKHETFPGWGPGYPMYDYWRLKHAVEELVRGAGFAHWTILRPTNFLQLFKSPASDYFFPGFKEDGVLRVAFAPDTKIAWLDGGDVGVAAAQAASEPGAFAGREIDLASEALTIEQVAGKLRKALGSEVRVHYYSDEEAAELAKGGRAILITAQRWANEVPSHSAVKAAKEFALTSVDEFFEKNKLF
ncbi:hypothetical protein SLS53_006599 [Cytospora paraplurivora]|uniref:NmrA-like domain-containing protein n=1 Tax=Cytospora paraplurivora TaxID=2898453 RepID=A0AAN9U2C6_9PEZI